MLKNIEEQAERYMVVVLEEKTRHEVVWGRLEGDSSRLSLEWRRADFSKEVSDTKDIQDSLRGPFFAKMD